MVIGLMWFPKLNQMLADYDGGGRTNIRGAVEGATSVRNAVERANLFETMEGDGAVEAGAVIDALPPEADRQILAALSDAFERDVPITFEWQPHADISVEVTPGEAPNEVHVILHSPPGQDFM
jgi:hypothetical protein